MKITALMVFVSWIGCHSSPLNAVQRTRIDEDSNRQLFLAEVQIIDGKPMIVVDPDTWFVLSKHIRQLELDNDFLKSELELYGKAYKECVSQNKKRT